MVHAQNQVLLELCGALLFNSVGSLWITYGPQLVELPMTSSIKKVQDVLEPDVIITCFGRYSL